MSFPIPCIVAATFQSGRDGGTALSNNTNLSVFTIAGVTVAGGDSTQHSNGITAVEVQMRPTDTNVTSMVALASGAFPGNSNQWPTAGFDPVVFDFDSMAVGDNTLTVRVVAEDGVTTQDHVVTVRRLTAGVVEITEIDFAGLSGADFITATSGLSIRLYQRGTGGSPESVRCWFNTGTESQPSESPALEIPISVIDGAGALAGNLATVLDAASVNGGYGWSASASGTVVTITDEEAGARIDADPLDSGTTITVTQQGADPI